jgi:hypothetical protein
LGSPRRGRQAPRYAGASRRFEYLENTFMLTELHGT